MKQCRCRICLCSFTEDRIEVKYESEKSVLREDSDSYYVLGLPPRSHGLL